jgi:hypothetical protein
MQMFINYKYTFYILFYLVVTCRGVILPTSSDSVLRSTCGVVTCRGVILPTSSGSVLRSTCGVVDL